jgi:DNA-binding MarR family transcriptional regulator
MGALHQPKTASAASPVDRSVETANRLLFRLFQSSNLIHITGGRAMARFGTTIQQWSVLGAIARPAVIDRGMTMTELTNFLLLSRQNLTLVVDRLQARKLIGREKDSSDGRNRSIKLTLKGRKLWSEMEQEMKAYHSTVLMGFSLKDRILFLELLDRLKENLTTVRSDSDGGTSQKK